MGWDVELQDRKTGHTKMLKNPFYKRGSNVRADVGPDGQLHQIVEAEADLSITFNYSSYYYEASEGDDRFLVQEDESFENYGLRALHGKSVYDSIPMLVDMITRIQAKYKNEHGEWLTTERSETVCYDESGKKIDAIQAMFHEIPYTEKEVIYQVNEGDTSNYWEATAANAIASLTQMLHMATDLIAEDCVWSIA